MTNEAAFPDLRIRPLWQSFSTSSLGFKLTCLYLFVEYVRPQSVWPAIDVLPYGQLTIIGAFIAMLADAGRQGWTHSPANGLLSLFTLTVLLSVVFAFAPSASLESWDQFFPWLVVYVVMTNTTTTRTRYLLLLVVFLLASFKMSQHGFRSWVGSGLAGRTWGVRGGQGWFHNAGELGIQMCVFLGMSTWFAIAFWHKTGRFGRALLIAMPLTAAGTVLASNSRGTVLGGIAVLLTIAWMSPYRARTMLAVGVVALIGFWFTPELLLERFEGAGDDATSVSRLTYWRHGMAMLNEHPLTGIGYFNWLTYYPIRFPAGDAYFGHELPHNILVQAGAELGYTGLLAYLALVACTFVINAGTRRAAAAGGDRVGWCLAAGLDAGLVGYLVNGQFVTVLYYPFFWIALAMSVALHRAVTVDVRQPRATSARVSRKNVESEHGSNTHGTKRDSRGS